MNAPERFEQLIAFLGSQLPVPVDQREQADGSIEFVAGDPLEVVVALTESSVIVSEYAGVWDTPFHFAAKPRRVGILKWRRLPETSLYNALTALVKGARDARRARFQPCRFCGQSTAPEWIREDGVCQSCAEQRSGAIH
jgi:hypothetical protein